MNNTITPEVAFGLLNKADENCILVDVRSASEFNSLHAQPAVHIPLEDLTSSAALQQFRNKKILCICQSGMRGKKAVDALTGQGLRDVVNVEGGTLAWNSANLPVVQGKQSISIERQVRICAGALVVLGCLAGLLLSTYLFAIPLFVGAGLVFAGVTDTCGMAIILGRCPWNSK